MKSKLLFLHTLSSLHAGTGQSVGAIDLSIAREKSTGIPFLPGSSIKGVLRDTAEDILQKDMTVKVFGPPSDAGELHSGSVSFGDARVLFLPVRSLAGTFAYVTSPFLLERASRDMEAVGLGKLPSINIPEIQHCLTPCDSMLALGEKVFFEELDFTRRKHPDVEKIAEALGKHILSESQLVKRLCIVHDDVMSFLFEQATEVRTRIRLEEETKVVKQGALWSEESLPSETVLLSFVTFFPPKVTKLKVHDVVQKVESLLKTPLQFGGNATVGQGLCTLSMTGDV